MQVVVLKEGSTTGILGYLWLKCVKIVLYVLALWPTSTASQVMLCLLLMASASNASSNVAWTCRFLRRRGF